MPIRNLDFNLAYQTLVMAGSNNKTHIRHGKKGNCPDGQGRNLLRDVRDEFREVDQHKPNLHLGLTAEHYKALAKAASYLNNSIDNIETW